LDGKLRSVFPIVTKLACTSIDSGGPCSTPSPRPDGTTRSRVALQVVVDVDSDTRVGGLVSSWDCNFWWVSITTSANVDLGTANIELRARVRLSSVKGDDLSAEKVLTCR